jgi:hypothetical protein
MRRLRILRRFTVIEALVLVAIIFMGTSVFLRTHHLRPSQASLISSVVPWPRSGGAFGSKAVTDDFGKATAGWRWRE